ncbi:hypothetical protein STEG23_006098 [Scotinomys teguina]
MSTQTLLRQETFSAPIQGRNGCKSTYNNMKNKTSPESRPPPTASPELCNVEKAEENDLKNSLMKMIEEALKGKMENAIKEIEEKKNKKLEEINKEIEEKTNKKLEEMNKEIEEKNKKLEGMTKEIEEKMNRKLEEIKNQGKEKQKLEEMNQEIEEKTNKKLEEINKKARERWTENSKTSSNPLNRYGETTLALSLHHPCCFSPPNRQLQVASTVLIQDTLVRPTVCSICSMSECNSSESVDSVDSESSNPERTLTLLTYDVLNAIIQYTERTNIQDPTLRD